MNSTRNIYNNDIDFKTLALQYPSFAKILKPNGQLDFSRPEAVQELTKTLLKRDFGLTIELPPDRLCPPVPNRFNYILWLQDLIDTTSDSFSDKYEPARKVFGLDIGTGASCIYPLLGCTQRSNWNFAGTDIDEESLKYARKNVAANELDQRITLFKSDRNGPLIPLDLLKLERIDFTMCNPPFYESKDDMISSAEKKHQAPFSACTGAEAEMVTPGGEVAFVSRMIEESERLQGRVQWYSTMLGKLSSVSVVIEKLKAVGITNWAVTDFLQGSKTRRWGVAWSYGDIRPKTEIARGTTSLQKHFLPFPSEYSFSVPEESFTVICEKLCGAMESIKLSWKWDASTCTGLGFTRENVWSRASRRKGRVEDEAKPSLQPLDRDVILGFKLLVTQKKDSNEVDVHVRWVRGNDVVLFESFCGMVKRKITSK
ncbi:DUF890 domain protein [Xylona heveae TC161]|uniref:DUF890 domain protein n=1 Tax=Xylona heveae (strain CBS 132557 / TC161) TaxID=1328760 RepID=A0A165HDP1_XYLHT|nr:DUF890 domain protein [Xylona heveae TC161]KZF23351.1 DUF890 domain protein [Xylona heveae TC161]